MSLSYESIINTWAEVTTDSDAFAELWGRMNRSCRTSMPPIHAVVNAQVVATARKAGVRYLLPLVAHIEEPDVLATLYRHRSPAVVGEVLANPHTPQDVIDRYVTSIIHPASPTATPDLTHVTGVTPRLSAQQLLSLYDIVTPVLRPHLAEAFGAMLYRTATDADDLVQRIEAVAAEMPEMYGPVALEFLRNVANHVNPALNPSDFITRVATCAPPAKLAVKTTGMSNEAVWLRALVGAADHITAELWELCRQYPAALDEEPGDTPVNDRQYHVSFAATTADYSVVCEELRAMRLNTYKRVARWLLQLPPDAVHEGVQLLTAELEASTPGSDRCDRLTHVATDVIRVGTQRVPPVLSEAERLGLATQIVHATYQQLSTVRRIDDIADARSRLSAVDTALFADTAVTIPIPEPVLHDAMVLCGLARTSRLEYWAFATAPNARRREVPDPALVRAVLTEVHDRDPDHARALHFAFATGSTHWPAPHLAKENPDLAANIATVCELMSVTDVIAMAAASSAVARSVARRFDDACVGHPGMVATVGSLLSGEWTLSLAELLETARLLTESAPANQ